MTYKSDPSKCSDCVQYHWGSCPVMVAHDRFVNLPDAEAYAELEHENSNDNSND